MIYQFTTRERERVREEVYTQDEWHEGYLSYAGDVPVGPERRNISSPRNNEIENESGNCQGGLS